MPHTSTVLIVDDEPISRDTLEALLISQNYHLMFAASGPQALAIAAKHPPDVVLLDVMMPGMTGFEVCRHLRRDPILREVPIIMVTALDDRDSRLQGLEAGADDFIAKPFDRAELRARVQTITQLNRYRHLLSERAKFEWVVEQAEDGYLILDAFGDIIYANAQAHIYLNIPLNEDMAAAEAFLDLAQKQYHCQPHTAWETWPTPSPLAAKTARYLVRPETKTATAFWLQVDLMEMTSRLDGAYLVQLRDITNSMITSNNLWTSNAMVSHKLKTPLALLTASLELLDTLVEGDLPLKKQSEIIAMARSRAIEIRDEIMRIFAYMEAPDMIKPGQGQCKLAKISDIIEAIQLNLHLQSVNLNYKNINTPETITLSLSQGAIELILWELLENARKFHPRQSPTLTINVTHFADGLRVQIIDDGITLSPEQLTKIWLPYYQAERGFSGQVAGMGLGLSTVASILWRTGQTCHAYNRDDQSGLVIEFGLPLADNR